MARGRRKPNPEAGVERTCLVTRETGMKSELIRFVTGPDNAVVPDIAGKLPGRGYYVSADRAILEQAVQKGVFARGAKQPVTVPDGLVDQIESQLARRVVDLISLARKSGAAVAGFEKVKSWLDREAASVLIQASDGSTRGKTKLSTPHFGTFIGWLTSDEIGLAFGRQIVIHGALASGGLSTRVVEEAKRLKGVRLGKGGDSHRERT